ncbi:MAG: MmcQ/YjbR family DNA-binding protein [Litoreibacter sp.]|nr:MmcQ/YjbR family DNA-binding protein [Litoreibacter sp.]
MSRDTVNDYCQSLPGAEWADESTGEHPSWKVGGKMFALIAHKGEGVSVKTPDIETASLLIEMGRAIKAPYFHRSWIRIPWGMVPDDELQERLAISYQLIFDKLPKSVQKTLREGND